LKAAREAYEKYLQVAPDAKNASEVRKRIEKLKG
jgi:regulator of sirC expression with transglutaminase-like and TPR domain